MSVNSSYLPELAELSEYVRERPGDTSARQDFMGRHPEYRILIDDCSPSGSLYFAERDTWLGGQGMQYHIRNELVFYLRLCGNYQVVVSFLEALGRIYTTDGVSTEIALSAERRKISSSLEKDYSKQDAVEVIEAATDTYLILSDQLPELVNQDMSELTPEFLGISDDDVPDELEEPSFDESDEEDEDVIDYDARIIPSFQLVHRPGKNLDIDQGWMLSQPFWARHILWSIRRAKTFDALIPLSKEIVKRQDLLPKLSSDGKPIRQPKLYTVLWDWYRCRRTVIEYSFLSSSDKISGSAFELISLLSCTNDLDRLVKLRNCIRNWSSGYPYDFVPAPSFISKDQWRIIKSFGDAKYKLLSRLSS